ncbi:transporter substrate-binding domain-containing protein [Pseudomonas sp. SL4(2022)]|uniref:substrate-binding periplasmic protein n=1 Tax=unclassified Pseudomonas TaxID=196821 RepID=UPI0021146C9A|nr:MULTISPECIES: transporter substrate-binding domain-containing protein [unclassified Pseudomonas]WAC44368.1 transporter substrate-binding domain-containing protein [Pseudomonas sp. SL4(2022)]
MTNESWEPYWIVRDGQVSGILSDVMQALDAHLDETFEADSPQPPLRAQKHFQEALVLIECCVNIAWRASPEQAKVSLWSDPLLSAEEVIIFPRGRQFAFTSLQDLQGRTISTVRGYGYAGNQYFTRIDSPNSIAQVNSVALARTEAGIIDRLELAYLLVSHPEIRGHAVRIEQGPVVNRSELRIRLHSSRADMLKPLNAAIARIRADGTLAKIVLRYTHPIRS